MVEAGTDDELARLLFSRRRSKRLRAVQRLSEMPAPDAVPQLKRLLWDGRMRVQEAAAEALRTAMGAPGRGVLLHALEADDEWVRLIAAGSLAREQDERARPVLEAALDHEDTDQWYPALEGLEHFGAAVRDVLERELERTADAPYFREQVASALRRIDDGGPVRGRPA